MCLRQRPSKESYSVVLGGDRVEKLVLLLKILVKVKCTVRRTRFIVSSCQWRLEFKQ